MSDNVAQVLKYLYERKLNSILDGNISWRNDYDEGFYITPGGVRKCDLSGCDMVYIDKDFKQHNGTASRELMFHSNIMKQSPGAKFIVHCHPPNSIAFCGLKKDDHRELYDLKLLFPELSINVGPNVSYLAAGSVQLADSVSSHVQGFDIVALENHGVVSVAETLERAIDIIETIEFYAYICNMSHS